MKNEHHGNRGSSERLPAKKNDNVSLLNAWRLCLGLAGRAKPKLAAPGAAGGGEASKASSSAAPTQAGASSK